MAESTIQSPQWLLDALITDQMEFQTTLLNQTIDQIRGRSTKEVSGRQ